ALAGLAALIAGCLGQLFRFCIQKLIQSFLDASPDQFLDLPLDYFLVKLYNVVGHGLLSPFRMVVLQLHSTSDRKPCLLFMPSSICAIYYTLSSVKPTTDLRKALQYETILPYS